MMPFLSFLPGFGIIFMLIFMVLPIIMIVKFFQISSDVREIKKYLMLNGSSVSGKLGDIEKKLSSIAQKPKTEDKFIGIWGDGVTEADRKEAEPLMERLSDMDGVIICDTRDGRVDIWSRYYWDKYGKTDERYRLIYKSYKD